MGRVQPERPLVVLDRRSGSVPAQTEPAGVPDASLPIRIARQSTGIAQFRAARGAEGQADLMGRSPLLSGDGRNDHDDTARTTARLGRALGLARRVVALG